MLHKIVKKSVNNCQLTAAFYVCNISLYNVKNSRRFDIDVKVGLRENEAR